MSRSDQIVGLNARAGSYLGTNGATDIARHYRNDELISEHTILACELSDRYAITDMLGEEQIKWNKYLLKNGRWVYEYAQESPWASGPVHFLALKNEEGEVIKETLWTKEEMDLYI